MQIAGLSVASIVVVAISMVVLASLGAWVTDVGQWYRSLNKPWFQPPNFLFAPAWTIIFALLGCSIVLAWNSSVATTRSRALLVLSFVLNYALNFGWSALFFGKRRPDLALIEVVVFWLSIVLLILAVRPLSSVAAWLLAPYLAWVSFATLLNQRIVALNAPFRS